MELKTEKEMFDLSKDVQAVLEQKAKEMLVDGNVSMQHEMDGVTYTITTQVPSDSDVKMGKVFSESAIEGKRIFVLK